MTLHLQKDIERLKEHLLSMGSTIATQTRDAITALIDSDEELARKVIAGDTDIDTREVEIEEEALKILALHQPVATDLRWVICAMKVNSDRS